MFSNGKSENQGGNQGGNQTGRIEGTGRGRGRGGKRWGNRAQHHVSMLDAVVKYRQSGCLQDRLAGETAS